MTHYARTASTGFLVLPMAETINRLIASITNWNDARVTRKALSRLTDRELNDIGLVRGDIDHISKI